MEFKLEGEEFILLQALLKVSQLCESGGAAKHAITQGQVLVDGKPETQRGKKIHAGQSVSYSGKTVKVLA